MSPNTGPESQALDPLKMPVQEKGWARKLIESVRQRIDNLFPRFKPFKIPTDSEYGYLDTIPTEHFDTTPRMDEASGKIFEDLKNAGFPEPSPNHDLETLRDDGTKAGAQSAGAAPSQPIKPVLAINNTLRTIDTSETFMEVALQNAAYVIADKLRTDDTIKDLVQSIATDFVAKIREMESRISMAEKRKITLIGPRGLGITLCIPREDLSTYKYVTNGLNIHCKLVKGGENGEKIEKVDASRFGYSFKEDGVQMIFELDPGESIFDTHTASEKRYFDLFQKSFSLLGWGFLQGMREINEAIGLLYTDSETGLENHLAYKKTRADLMQNLKQSGEHFTEHSIEILPDNLAIYLLGDYGRDALMKMIADQVSLLDTDMTFAYKHIDRNMAVIFIDRTNSPEIKKRLYDITASMSRRVAIKSSEDLIVNVELITKEH